MKFTNDIEAHAWSTMYDLKEAHDNGRYDHYVEVTVPSKYVSQAIQDKYRDRHGDGYFAVDFGLDDAYSQNPVTLAMCLIYIVPTTQEYRGDNKNLDLEDAIDIEHALGYESYRKDIDKMAQAIGQELRLRNTLDDVSISDIIEAYLGHC